MPISNCTGGASVRASRLVGSCASPNLHFNFAALRLCVRIRPDVANAQIVRRDGRRHARQPPARHGARDGLCEFHGRHGRVAGAFQLAFHHSEFVPPAAGRRRVDGGVHSHFQGKGKNTRRNRDVARGQRRHFRPRRRRERRSSAWSCSASPSCWPCINSTKTPNSCCGFCA